MDLSEDQSKALELLRDGHNVFLTGVAGSGKSHVIKTFTRDLDPKFFPILASTGRAAILVGGRTFHSFFGLGIMEGGPEATFERAKKDKALMGRLRKVEGVIIDEISMIHGEVLAVAEALCQVARAQDLPWGGLQVVVVGDFAQLPPVTQGRGRSAWAFLNPVWKKTGFCPAMLLTNHRTEEADFIELLNDLRQGTISEKLQRFLDEKTCALEDDFEGTRLLPRRYQTESFNLEKLQEIEGEEVSLPTSYYGEDRYVVSLKKNAPIPEALVLKEGCRVMFLQNDPKRRWVNGSTGVVESFLEDKVRVLLDSGRGVHVEKVVFSLQNHKAEVIAAAENYPLSLAYATTIHKSQGMTLDRVGVDIRGLWEPGQAYVALSRLKSSEGLFLQGWSEKSIFVDPIVRKFYHHVENLNQLV